MARKPSFTVFEYQYRDAANFKAWGLLLLTGTLSRTEVSAISACLEDGCLFVAEQLGIPPLYEELYQYSDGPTDDDHAYHEFLLVRPATCDEADKLPPWGSTKLLLSAFIKAQDQWDITLSPHYESYWWD